MIHSELMSRRKIFFTIGRYYKEKQNVRSIMAHVLGHVVGHAFKAAGEEVEREREAQRKEWRKVSDTCDSVRKIVWKKPRNEEFSAEDRRAIDGFWGALSTINVGDVNFSIDYSGVIAMLLEDGCKRWEELPNKIKDSDEVGSVLIRIQNLERRIGIFNQLNEKQKCSDKVVEGFVDNPVKSMAILKAKGLVTRQVALVALRYNYLYQSDRKVIWELYLPSSFKTEEDILRAASQRMSWQDCCCPEDNSWEKHFNGTANKCERTAFHHICCCLCNAAEDGQTMEELRKKGNKSGSEQRGYGGVEVQQGVQSMV